MNRSAVTIAPTIPVTAMAFCSHTDSAMTAAPVSRQMRPYSAR